LNNLVLVALGGNAFQSKGDKGSVEDYFRNASIAAEAIVRMIKEGYRVVVTHGNGPQVGLVAEWMIAGFEKGFEMMTLDIAGAMTQGWLGYILQQSILNKLIEEKLLGDVVKGVVTIVTQTIVDLKDPAFSNPTKFIGPWYENEEVIAKLASRYGWSYKPDPRGGYRRVVSSPDPVAQVEVDAIRTLINSGYIVIASGGGGIPVCRGENGLFRGVEAVIDKDLAGERLATALGAEIYMILTDVDYVYIDYGKPSQKPIRSMKVSEAEKYYEAGMYPPGSMGPKILACIRFIRNGGKIAIIAHLNSAYEALIGLSGTRILPD